MNKRKEAVHEDPPDEEIDPPCMLCECGFEKDQWGSHINSKGGYAGPCTAPAESDAQR